ncbi:hypothetical protein K2173_027427 [Erythroxylum novogranatense]|uniref:Uncharacterized protein n=1 Tax=Erythroxylum novogranatense TaxID=1862640 RepID=A0AAV8U1J8_9ROSI|nr:hypothetical protein K2173_027427 [Erythroxylum novogranatense]
MGLDFLLSRLKKISIANYVRVGRDFDGHMLVQLRTLNWKCGSRGLPFVRGFSGLGGFTPEQISSLLASLQRRFQTKSTVGGLGVGCAKKTVAWSAWGVSSEPVSKGRTRRGDPSVIVRPMVALLVLVLHSSTLPCLPCPKDWEFPAIH